MTDSIELFFDFVSPFAYFAHCRLPGIAARHGRALEYRPISLFEVRRAAGNTGPAAPQIPAKFRYVCEDMRRWARRYGIPFILPWAHRPGQPLESLADLRVPAAGMDSARANKGMFLAIERGQARDYADRLWSATFGAGGLVGDEALLRRVAAGMGWQDDAFMAFVDSAEAEDRYRAVNAGARQRHVFGVPTMLVGDEMWWGNDRLELLDNWLSGPDAPGRV